MAKRKRTVLTPEEAEKIRYQNLVAAVESLGFKVEDIPMLLKEPIEVIMARSSKRAG